MDDIIDTRTTAPFEPEDGDSSDAEEALLIVNGTELFPLKHPVVTIGRRFDNTLVLNDPRVSRAHAELRSIRGRFVIFDTNSTGGTYVNGKRVAQSVLYDGDVVSLAGVHLIFKQKNLPRREPRQTAPF